MDKNIVSKIDIAIILTIITSVSYCLSYVYKAGEFLYYGIPLNFIDIGTRDVFFIMLLIFPLILFFIWNIYSNTDNVLNKKLISRHIKQSKRYSLLEEQREELSSSLSVLLKNYKESPIEDMEVQILKLEKGFGQLNKSMDKEIRKKKLSRIFYITFAIISFLFFIAVLFYLYKPDSVMLALLMVIQLVVTFILLVLIQKKYYLYAIILTLVFLIIVPFIMGYQSAVSEKKYIIFEENEETFVVLTIYKEQFLFAPLDKDNQNYKNTFNFKEIKEVINFEYASIGNLTKNN